MEVQLLKVNFFRYIGVGTNPIYNENRSKWSDQLRTWKEIMSLTLIAFATAWQKAQCLQVM